MGENTRTYVYIYGIYVYDISSSIMYVRNDMTKTATFNSKENIRIRCLAHMHIRKEEE